jgi:truncated hemoglobin YjbI
LIHDSSSMREQLVSIINSLGSDPISRSVRLVSILEEFYVRMSADDMIGFFFAGKDLKHIANQQARFILNAAGMIPKFEGKGPATAHVGLPPILPGFFDRRIMILNETLLAHHLAPEVVESWIAFESSFRDMITSPH